MIEIEAKIESTSEVKWDDFEGNGKEIEAKKRQNETIWRCVIEIEATIRGKMRRF